MHICGFVGYAREVSLQPGDKPMCYLSIVVTPDQHQRLKAIAALHGKTIKDYVLERALPPLPEMNCLSEEEALHQLETFLKPRIEAAERAEVVNQNVTEIIDELK